MGLNGNIFRVILPVLGEFKGWMKKAFYYLEVPLRQINWQKTIQKKKPLFKMNRGFYIP